MKLKNKLFHCIILLFSIHITHAATFTIFNISGRDILVHLPWKEYYVKLSEGQKLYCDSSIKSVSDIEWITDEPNNKPDIAWTRYKTDGLRLDAVKLGYAFSILPSGKFEDNFSMPSNVIMKSNVAKKMAVPESIYVADNLSGSLVYNFYFPKSYQALVVENATNKTILLKPFVRTGSAGFISGGYHCILPGQSRIYALVGGNILNFLEYVQQAEGMNQWYVLQHPMPNLTGGKIIIGTNQRFAYVPIKGNIQVIRLPQYVQAIVAPAACQVSK